MVDQRTAQSIGYGYLASAIERDAALMPHNSDVARADVVAGLILLEAVRCQGYVLVPREPTYGMLRELHGAPIIPPAAEARLRDAWADVLDAAPDPDPLLARQESTDGGGYE